MSGCLCTLALFKTYPFMKQIDNKDIQWLVVCALYNLLSASSIIQ